MLKHGLLVILIIFVSAIAVEYAIGQLPVTEEITPDAAVEAKAEPGPAKDETGEPVEKLSLNEIRHLIEQLGDESFAEREQAHRELSEQGEYILFKFDEIIEEIAEASKDPEVFWRVEAIRRELTRSAFENSRWRLTYTEKRNDLSLKEKSIIFLANKSFDYIKDGAGREPANNSEWSSADNNQLTFSFNNRYAVYEGKRVSAKVIEGVANNIRGKTWKWRLTFIE